MTTPNSIDSHVARPSHSCARIVVVATGTDVGKTHVTCALLAHFASVGVRARAYKPVASGVDPHCEDTARHAEASAASEIAPSFAYARPVSPHFAARGDGRPVDLRVIAERACELESDATQPLDVLVVESAGGLFSPLAPGVTNVDLVNTLSPASVVLVAPDRLGALHDVRATLIAATASAIAIDAIVLSAPNIPDSATSTNAAELEIAFGTRVAAVFPRECYDSPASRTAAAAAVATLQPFVRASAR
jgi:dethiobiotin synthetase